MRCRPEACCCLQCVPRGAGGPSSRHCAMPATQVLRCRRREARKNTRQHCARGARGGATTIPFSRLARQCGYCAVQSYAAQRPGRLAPSLFALGTAVRLVEILLRRAAQWLLTWWMPIRAVHHVTRLCTARLARCGVLEHRALHAVCALHPSQFGANLARGMIERTIDAGRASWVQVLAVLCGRLRRRWRCPVPRCLGVRPIVLCMRCCARSVRPSGRARAMRLGPIAVGLIELCIRPNSFGLSAVPVIVVVALPCGRKTSTTRRCRCRSRASRCSAGSSPVPVIVIVPAVAARCIVIIIFFLLLAGASLDDAGAVRPTSTLSSAARMSSCSSASWWTVRPLKAATRSSGPLLIRHCKTVARLDMLCKAGQCCASEAKHQI